MALKVDKVLSRNFRLSEFVRSEVAEEFGLDNTPDEESIENIEALCKEVLQLVREATAGPIKITSGYRSPELNGYVGGSEDSQHMTGQAADIKSLRVFSEHLMMTISNLVEKGYIEVDQAILYHIDQGGHVHVSYKKDGDNRNEFLFSNEHGDLYEY